MNRGDDVRGGNDQSSLFYVVNLLFRRAGSEQGLRFRANNPTSQWAEATFVLQDRDVPTNLSFVPLVRMKSQLWQRNSRPQKLLTQKLERARPHSYKWKTPKGRNL